MGLINSCVIWHRSQETSGANLIYYYLLRRRTTVTQRFLSKVRATELREQQSSFWQRRGLSTSDENAEEMFTTFIHVTSKV